MADWGGSWLVTKDQSLIINRERVWLRSRHAGVNRQQESSEVGRIRRESASACMGDHQGDGRNLREIALGIVRSYRR